MNSTLNAMNREWLGPLRLDGQKSAETKMPKVLCAVVKMPKVLCAVVMLALVTAGPAFAQNETSAPASGSTGTSVPSPTSKEQPGLYGSKIIGLKVFDKDGEQVGSIKDVLIAHNQLQKYVIAVGGSIGGIGEKNHAVDSDKLTFEHDPKGNLQARVGLSKDEVQQLTEYKY